MFAFIKPRSSAFCWGSIHTCSQRIWRSLIRIACSLMPTCIFQEKSRESEDQKHALLLTPYCFNSFFCLCSPSITSFQPCNQSKEAARLRQLRARSAFRHRPRTVWSKTVWGSGKLCTRKSHTGAIPLRQHDIDLQAQNFKSGSCFLTM